MSIEIVTGDIFDSTEKYLCHQTNCVTNKAAHLSKDVFEKYPWADIYTGRTDPDKPGHIIIRGNGQDQDMWLTCWGNTTQASQGIQCQLWTAYGFERNTFTTVYYAWPKSPTWKV